MSRPYVTIDGNEAAAYIAHKTNEVVAIYPISPASPMGELAVESGYWPLYRFDPRRGKEGKNPLQLDSKAPKIPLADYIYKENRYRSLVQADSDAASSFVTQAQTFVDDRWKKYASMARESFGDAASVDARPGAPAKLPPGMKPAADGKRSVSAALPAGAKPAGPKLPSRP